MESIIIQQFNSLKQSGKPKDGEFTVLAGLVIGDVVVALGTGLSCLNYTQLSDQGDSVNDSHAEVLCIRSFRAYLYHQMSCAMYSQDSILDYDPARNPPLRLAGGKQLHMYISQAPCGDASMDMLSHRQTQDEILKNMNSLQNTNNRMDQLFPHGNIIGVVQRGRMDYSIKGVARTKPGRIDSIPTTSMSCSDKIILWNIIGISGALISLLIEPIYLSSITVADVNVYVLEESLCSRMHGITMDSIYKPNFPKLYSCESKFKFKWTASAKPCQASIIWNPIDGSQVLDMRGMKLGTSYKNSAKIRSFVCNLELFSRFSSIVKNLDVTIPNYLSYYQTKLLNTSYQMAKDIAIKQGTRGWIKKNTSPDFTI